MPRKAWSSLAEKPDKNGNLRPSLNPTVTLEVISALVLPTKAIPRRSIKVAVGKTMALANKRLTQDMKAVPPGRMSGKIMIGAKMVRMRISRYDINKANNNLKRA